MSVLQRTATPEGDALVTAVRGMSGAGAPPRANGELVFDAPWQGRAFAMAIGMVQRLGLEWDDFRGRLVAEISRQPDRPYYESWLAALESLARDHGIVAAVRPTT